MSDASAETQIDLQKAQRQLRPPSRLDRQPPHSIEAEQGVIGCIMLEPQESITRCIGEFHISSDTFYDLRHKTIYQVLMWMYDRQRAIDVITLQQVLRDMEKLESIGGVAYLASLPDSVPSAANLGFYVDIIKEKHVLRAMIGTCTQIVANVYEHQGEARELVDRCERDFRRAADLYAHSSPSNKTARALVLTSINTIEELHRNQGATPGIATGFFDLDRITLGLHAGEVALIAARPSVGKSSLAMNIVDHVAVELGLPVGVFSLEMTAESLMLRMMCSRARVNLRHVSSGVLVQQDFTRLTDASLRLSPAPIHIDDSRGLTILQLKAKARRMSQQYGIRLFVIDYLQLLHSSNHRASNREQEVSDISSGVHSLAGELNVPVLVLAQLNREVERRGPASKPRLSDLRESGSLEQDADLVVLLYKRDGDDDGLGSTAATVPVNMLIAKQRNGPTGEIQLTFMKSYTRFESATQAGQEVSI